MKKFCNPIPLSILLMIGKELRKSYNMVPDGSGMAVNQGLHVGPLCINQRTNGPVNAHLISWPSKAQNIQNLENIW